MGTAPHVLPDVLPCGLRAVICGTAAGDLSYLRKAYYAEHRNCFWDALREVGLTPHTLKAEDFLTLPSYGLGLTDIAKFEFGTDVTLRMEAFGVPTFMEKIRLCRPNIVAFNGKKAARIFGCARQFMGKRAVEHAAPWKSPKAGLSHCAWKSRNRRGISTFSTAPTTRG